MPKRRPSTRFVTAHSSAQHWPRRTSMPSVFTAFVRCLQGAATPDADLFHDAWHGLRAALANELKRRGLWQSPPSYLGVCGWERWDSESPAADASRRQASALGELVADCYAFIFVDRLQSLKRHLEDKPDIDGLILLNVRHFLHERQKEHDPLGFRIFELLQAAVEDAIASGALHLLAGDKKVRNDTLLGFAPAAELPPTPLDLEPIVTRWNDELMPALVTARGRQLTAVVQRLRGYLLQLPQRGVEAFRFKDLLDPLKKDARRRWAALLGEEEKVSVAPAPGAIQVPAPVLPGSAVESRQSFEDLTRCISASIDHMEADARTRTQLSVLWHYLGRQQLEDEGTGRDEPDPGTAGECLPSYRKLGQSLNIPRERLPVLFTLLRRLVAHYREGGGAKRAGARR
ncbi:MAG: hypothetical protein QOJ16_1731 [Acidobacteriota bacterium]|jgi:hypothetical protein|nr:hypothetical protein [Acidobacteriota bacterium]